MTTLRRIRTLIVDDEPLARERIREMLRGDSEIEIVGECASGSEALATLQEQTPDLLFPDVQMPEMDGFTVLEALGAEHLPLVIFVTAYDQYALRALEVYALDYLLKPFDRERFGKAVHRAKVQIQRQRGGEWMNGFSPCSKSLKRSRNTWSGWSLRPAGASSFSKPMK